MKRYVTLMLCTLALCGCRSQKSDEHEASDERMQYQVERNEVTVDTLRLRTFTRELISNGRLVATRRSTLTFPVSGTIVAVEAANGTRVGAGQVIAVVDTTEYALQLHRACLSLDKSRLDFYDKLIGLDYAAGDTVTPPAEVLKLARIRSGYADAEASYRSARRNLDQCFLRAPFAGKVADIGQQIYERAGGEFCTVIDDRRFNVRFSVLESEYGLLAKGQEVVVSPFSDLRKQVRGRITAINPTIDANGQVQVDAEVANDGTLTDGMNVQVSVREQVPAQLTVPKSAVVIRDNLEVLFRYKEGKAQWTYVHTSLANSAEYVVAPNTDRGAELNEGDLIITSGNLNLADGSEVVLATDDK